MAKKTTNPAWISFAIQEMALTSPNKNELRGKIYFCDTHFAIYYSLEI